MKNDCLSCPSHLVLVELAAKKLSRAFITISTTFLDMVLAAIRNAQFDDDGRRKYRDFIKQVANPAGRKKNESIVMKDLLLEKLFQDDGNIPDIDKILYQLARVRLLKFVKSRRNFDFNELFGTTGAKELEAISTRSELREFKDLLSKLRINLDSTIKTLPN